MGLSEYLQSSELLEALPTLTHESLMESILSRGMTWFDAHPEERRRIRDNLDHFGLDSGPSRTEEVIRHVLLHYFEKFLAFCGNPDQYHQFIAEHVDGRDSLGAIGACFSQGKSVLLASSHFGGVELIPPLLSINDLPVTPVLRFRTAQLSSAAQQRAAAMAASGRFRPIRFIEIGKPGVAAALEMAAVLRRKEALLTMFDEKTEYSVAVTLLGRRIWGGAGLDRLVKFAAAPVSVFLVVMLREDGGRYRMTAREVAAGDGLVPGLFGALEEIVRAHPEQWYFLHEEIPGIQ